MGINWHQVIATLVATVGGGGVVLATAAWLVKQIVTSRMERDAEAFRIRLKADADRETESLRAQLRASADLEIERTRAFFRKAFRVQGRQLEVLTKLYSHLWKANESFQGLVGGNRMPDGPTDSDFEKWTVQSLQAAYEELLNGRLLVPQPLAERCDEFLKKVLMGRWLFFQARDPGVGSNPEVWVKFSEGAHKSAFESVPRILTDIETAARAIIHGTPAESEEGEDGPSADVDY